MLKDKIALIAGISSGIGIATAKKFLAEGATVIGLGQMTEEAEALGIRLIPCDLADGSAVMVACAQLSTQLDRLDALVTVCDKAYPAGVQEIEPALLDEAARRIMAPMLLVKGLNELLHKSQNPSISGRQIPSSSGTAGSCGRCR